MIDIQQIKSVVTSIQKIMQQRGYSTQTQWDDLTITPSPVLPKTAFLQRLSLYGLNLSNNEVKSLWNYFDIQPFSIRYEDFENIMSATFPSAFRDDYQSSYNSSDFRQTRPYTTQSQRTNYQSTTQRERSVSSRRQNSTNFNPQSNQQDLIRKRSHDPEDDGYDHNYYTCKSIKEREIRTMPLSDIRTLDSLSNSSIQRQNFDGPKTQRKTFKGRNSLKRTLATISDAAYAIDPTSWSCFLRWRDPTKDTIDAQDLINAIEKDQKIVLNLADVQKVIDKYGPLNQMTFKLMITEGAKYSLYKDFDDDDYDY